MLGEEAHVEEQRQASVVFWLVVERAAAQTVPCGVRRIAELVPRVRFGCSEELQDVVLSAEQKQMMFESVFKSEVCDCVDDVMLRTQHGIAQSKTFGEVALRMQRVQTRGREKTRENERKMENKYGGEDEGRKREEGREAEGRKKTEDRRNK